MYMCILIDIIVWNRRCIGSVCTHSSIRENVCYMFFVLFLEQEQFFRCVFTLISDSVHVYIKHHCLSSAI